MSERKPTEANLQTLLEILMIKEARQQERAEATTARHNRWIRSFEQFYILSQNYERQKNCGHLKGGKCRTAIRDYSVRLHTFVDGSQQIKCMICGWEVWNKKNWRFKWAFGMSMVKQSTNTPTSSERFTGTKVLSDDNCSPVYPKRVKVTHDDRGGRIMRAEWD